MPRCPALACRTARAAALIVAMILAAQHADAAGVLLVVNDSAALATSEQQRKTSIESWGHTVTAISASSPQGSFDTAVAAHDVAYVCETITSADLGHKLREAGIGVVSEPLLLHATFGFSTSAGQKKNVDAVTITNNTHPITSGLATGSVTVSTSKQWFVHVHGSLAPGGAQLATVLSAAGLMAVESGAQLANAYNGSSQAFERRVCLPIGDSGFDWSKLNSNGLLLVRQALDWAAAGGNPLLLHLRMDETSGTVAANAASGGGHGAYAASPTLGGLGQRDLAVEFSADSANDRVSIPASSVNGQTRVTVAWWMRTTKTGEQAVLSGNASSLDNSFLVFFYNHTTFRPYMNGANRSLTVPSIADGRWRHFAYTYDRATGAAELFINAVSAGTLSYPATSGGISVANGGLMIAEEQDSVGGGFTASQALAGALDDFRIYNKILSQEEIIELYGLVGHWAFDEGTGATAADASPNANDASFDSGAPQWVDGVRGGALYFDGASDAVTSLPVTPPTAGTIAFWMKRDDAPAAREGLAGLGANFEFWQDPDGLLRLDLLTDGDAGGIRTTTPLDEPNRWVHVAAAYDEADDSYAIYLDGALHKSGTATLPMSTQTAALLTFGAGASDNFTGALDDLRLYSYKLSAAQVAELYGLVLHWKLDETAGAVAADASGLGNAGAYNGGPTLGHDAPRGYGVGFTNDAQNVTAAASASLNELAHDGGDLSVALWVNPSAPGSHDRPLVHKGSTTQQRTPNLTLNFNDNRVEYAVSATGNWNAGDTSNAALPADQWSHVILIKSGRDYSLYINGKLDSTRTVSGDSYGNAGPLYLGANPYAAGDASLMDDLRVYNRAITPHEIAEVYGLVAHWKLDEASGTTAADSSGMGHHAALTGSPQWVDAKVEGGHAFDYLDGEDYFTAPSTRVLDELQASDYSVAAYFQPLSAPPGAGSDHDAAYGIVRKNGNHIGLMYSHDLRLSHDHWLASGPAWSGVGDWATGYPSGAFHHIAGVVKQSTGEALIYVDGELRQTASFTPGAATHAYGGAPWRIGVSAPGLGSWGHPAHGVIDDARLYNRALTDAEVYDLYQAGQSSGMRIIRWVEVR